VARDFTPPRRTFSDTIQSTAIVISLIISTVAVVVSQRALSDQERTNRSQLTLNQLAQDRFERRFVSQVAVWSVNPYSIAIQNRSPSPLTDVWVNVTWTLKADLPSGAPPDHVAGNHLVSLLHDIPPCTKFHPSVTKEKYIAIVTLPIFFNDSTGFWKLDHKGITKYRRWVDDFKGPLVINDREMDVGSELFLWIEFADEEAVEDCVAAG